MPKPCHSLRQAFVLMLLGTSVLVGCGRSTSWARRSGNENDRGVAKLTSDERPSSDHDHLHSSDFQLTSASTPVNAAALLTLGPDDDFDSMIRDSSGIILVDFYADWCGPCRKQGTILHALEPDAAEYGARILKVNVDEHKDIAKRYSVSSLPTLIVFKDGAIVDRKTGLTDRRAIDRLLKM